MAVSVTVSQHEASPRLRQERGRLLVVSQDPGFAVIAGVLFRRRWHVATTSRFSDGHRAALDSGADLVVIDLDSSIDNFVMVAALRRVVSAKIVAIVAPDTALAPEIGRLEIDSLLLRPLDLNDLLEAVASLLGSAESSQCVPRLSAHVLRALGHLERHYAGPLTVASIARAIGLSESRLAHVFRDETGLSVKECVLRLRIEAAKARLGGTDEKLEEVAQAVGFAHASHLCRIFQTWTGLGPGAYRKGVTGR
jgi:AraC-like DNA-binding protein